MVMGCMTPDLKKVNNPYHTDQVVHWADARVTHPRVTMAPENTYSHILN